MRKSRQRVKLRRGVDAVYDSLTTSRFECIRQHHLAKAELMDLEIAYWKGEYDLKDQEASRKIHQLRITSDKFHKESRRFSQLAEDRAKEVKALPSEQAESTPLATIAGLTAKGS